LRTLAAAYADRLASDEAAVDEVRRVADPPGTLLVSRGFPASYDLNRLVLELGGGDIARACAVAAEALPHAARPRVTAWAPGGPVSHPGWEREEQLVMVFHGEPPPWPDGVEEVPAARLHRPRLAAWRAEGTVPDAVAIQLSAMQTHAVEAAGGRCVAAVEDGATVAWANALRGSVDDVWVTPERRGHGLGRAVVSAALAAGGWHLTCDVDDPRPQGLYRSLGFREVGRLVHLTRS
jgi:ribosomal protein S18 acetylase RimI-like enzyme